MLPFFKSKKQNRELELWHEIGQFATDGTGSVKAYENILTTLQSVQDSRAYHIYLMDAAETTLNLENTYLSDDSESPKTGIDLSAPLLALKPEARFQDLAVITVEGSSFVNIPLFRGENIYLGTILCGPVNQQRLFNPELLQEFSLAAGNAIHIIQQNEVLREKVAVLESRNSARQQLRGSTLEIDNFINLLLELALSATRHSSGFVAICDRETGNLQIKVAQNIKSDFEDQLNLSLENGLFSWSPEKGEILMLRDHAFIDRHNVKSIFAMPIIESQELIGIFTLLNFDESVGQSEFGMRMMNTFCDQIKLALQNSNLFGQFTERYLGTLKTISEAYDMLKPETVGHSQLVANIAKATAERMSLPAEKVKSIYTAGLLHDVGMCGIVETSSGMVADFNHPIIGASMIEMLPISEDVVEGIRTHHESLDGWGFPNGLKGEQIPLTGRILAVAEYYAEAIIRKNDSSTPVEDIIRKIESHRNVVYDGEVIDALVSVLRSDEGIAIPEALNSELL